MNFHQEVDALVRRAIGENLTTGDIVFPLINLAASVLANTTVENNLNPDDEIEGLRDQLAALFGRYMNAYHQQAPRRTIN